MKAAVPAVDAPGNFCCLGVTDWLVSTCKKLGMAAPTQVQAACIPAILAGRSVIGSSQTGSGKTAAFALPILQLLGSDPFGVFALVLTPTRWVSLNADAPASCCAQGMPRSGSTYAFASRKAIALQGASFSAGRTFQGVGFGH